MELDDEYITDEELAEIEAYERARIGAEDRTCFAAQVRTSLHPARAVWCELCQHAGIREIDGKICPRCLGVGEHPPRPAGGDRIRASWGMRRGR